jgi:myo-inositol-1(or 4)-monophosphatase
LRGADPDLALDEISRRLTAAVREAGILALSKFGSPIRKWTKGKDSPVCEADVEVDQLLRERLSEAAPGYGWLSEESVDDPTRLAARRVWIVDPIDGTRGFINGHSDWAVSVALVEDGRPVVAALFAPAIDEFLTAVKGEGTRRNGEPVAASAGDSFKAARVAGPERLVDWFAGFAPGWVRVPRIHSLALRIARVATGALDAAMAGRESHDWDLAAADLLVHEAGGVLTTLDGRTPTYNRPDPVHGALFAAGRARHAAVMAAMRGRVSDFA